jgi:hypothetical protein
MSAPLLTFLTDFEQAVVNANPTPEEDASWKCARTVNYTKGLARMEITLRHGSQSRPRGYILLQAFLLADGTFCLKAQLGWEGTDYVRWRAIYSKPETQWVREAQRAANDWLTGPPANSPGHPSSSASAAVADGS